MPETMIKKFDNGRTLTYTRLDGNRPRFMFVEKDAQGHLIQMGEVYNPVLTPKNIQDFDPQTFDKKDGRWMTFYPYQEGQNPFDFVASKSTFRVDFEMGNFCRFYSPDEKPYARSLLKESGQLTGLYQVHASKPFGEVTYIDMAGVKHKCFWCDGKPFMGEIVKGSGKDLIWNEEISTYVDGQELPEKQHLSYTRQYPDRPFVLSKFSPQLLKTKELKR